MDELKEQLQKWHEEGNYQAIIEAIDALAEAEWDEDLIGQLARAYNNRGQQGDYELAVDLLLSIAENGQHQAVWHFRLGYAYYYLDRDALALQEFEQALALAPDDEDTLTFIARCQRNLTYPTATKPFTVRVQEFWQAFLQQEEMVRQRIDAQNWAFEEAREEAMQMVQDMLHLAFAEIYFEMGYNGKKYELILTAEGQKHRLFKLRYWQKQAPESLKTHWNFWVGRQKVAHIEDFSLKMNGVDIAADEVWFYPEILEGRQVGLTLFSLKWQQLLAEDEDAAYAVAAILLDQCIGEASAIVHIGWLELVEEQPLETGLLLSALDEFIKTQVDSETESFDPCDYFLAYQMEPVDLTNAWDLRQDVFAGNTACVEVVNSYYQGDGAIMDEHQADGVVYAFLFYDNDAIAQADMVGFRGAIEDEMMEKAAGFGEIIGGATGLRYSYIDCICYDVQQFAEVAEEVLNSRKVLSERGFHVFRREFDAIDLSRAGLMPNNVRRYVDNLAEDGYLSKLIDYMEAFIQDGVDKGRFTRQEAEHDLNIALVMAYAHNNMDQYEHYWQAAQWLKRVEDLAEDNGTWYYRYSAALMYLGHLDEALDYAERGVAKAPDYPWGWLNLAGLRSHFGNQVGALAAIDAGLALVPDDYEFLRRRQEILSGATLEEMENHYINEEADQELANGDMANSELVRMKKEALEGIVCHQAGLAAIKAVLEPENWEADNPYCRCQVHWHGWVFTCLLMMNEAALSKKDPIRLQHIKDSLPHLDEQAQQWLVEASGGFLVKDKLVLKECCIQQNYIVVLAYDNMNALDERIYPVFFTPDLVIDQRYPGNYMPKMYEDAEINAVEAHIEQYFGHYDGVMHELVSPDIHVDICIIEPTEEKPYYTLVTLGAGAHRMTLPEEVEADKWGRAEFVIYLPPDWQLESADENWYWPVRSLKATARLPMQENSWLGPWHSISHAGGRYADNVAFTGIILIWPQDVAEEANSCVLPNGENVNFYQLLPLYEEEIQYKLEYGSEALLEAMQDVDPVLNIHRPNTQANFVRPNQKDFLIKREDILPMLTDWQEADGCLATDRIMVEGAPVGYMYREEPDEDYPDSGWRFMAGDESDDYMADENNVGIYALNTVCNYDPAIIPLLHFPYGTAFYRDSDGNFHRDEVGPQKRW